jgi:hypothetical protein
MGVNAAIDPCILDLGTRWKCQFDAPAALHQGEELSRTHWTGGWAGFRNSIEEVEGKGNLAPTRTRTQVPMHSRSQPVIMLTATSRIHPATVYGQILSIYLLLHVLSVLSLNYLIHNN